MTIKQRGSISKDEIAAGYDRIAEKVFVSPWFYDEVLDVVREWRGDVLEIGVGQGVVLKNIGSRGGRNITSLTGVDVSERLMEMARKNVPEAKIIKGDAEALPFQDQSFDIVVMVDVFQYLLDFGKALGEVHRVLRPEGKLLITVPNRKWILFKSYIKARKNIQPVEDHFFDYREITQLLKENKFSILRYRGADALRFYGKRHRFERLVATLFPFLNRYMKKLVFYCAIANHW
jgi:ubiquinone/menaquinone biosynthesis C-methylase UbiE